MSREQDYFPPNGTKYQWHPKSLNYSPWCCNLDKEREPNLWLFPLSVQLTVDLVDGEYRWSMDARDFTYTRHHQWGTEKTALGACLAAERAGETFLDQQLPDWVRTALANKWRPPAV